MTTTHEEKKDIAYRRMKTLNPILKEHGIEVDYKPWTVEVNHLLHGHYLNQGIEYILKGDFFASIDIGRGDKNSSFLYYDYTMSSCITWVEDIPSFNTLFFLGHIKELFIRRANCGYLSGESVSCDFSSPYACKMASQLFPDLTDSLKVPLSQWEGKHHKAFKDLFPASYVGCRRVTQDEYKLIVSSPTIGEFEIPKGIAIAI
jgi:hypothetical protein